VSETETAEPTPPLLRIVKGDPTPEEVAALVAVVSAMAAGAQASTAQGRPKSQWASHARRLRGPHRHGPGAWRASAR
jgi:acyl-CoA carboxylase epsilon subunit